MFRREEWAPSILPYIVGFGLSRLMEYPIRLLILYPLGFLFHFMGFISAEENREALQEVPQVYLLTRWIPRIYRFLNETRVENLLARRR